MKYALLLIGLCVVLNPIFAIDYERVSFDPLPDNAEELARAHVEEYLAQRYPEETIVVGEAIPMYVLENEIKVLDFIMELDGEEPCTFERELAIYTYYTEKYNAFQDYYHTVWGNHEAQVIINNGEDDVYNRLFNELREADYLCNSISHIVIAFVDGSPRIIGGHNLNVLLSSYLKLTDAEMERFVGFGIVGYYRIYEILKNENERDGLEWLFTGGREYTFTTEYPVYTYPYPMNFSFFSSGLKARGKEDIPPLDIKFGIYGEGY